MESRQFVREHCRDLSEQVIDNHIKMFVNEYSVNIGADGRCAIKTLNNINPDSAIFIDEQ
jgi:1,4-dihydroxy-6-naphthoate synthase